MKNLFLAASATLLLASCGKDNTPSPDKDLLKKKYPVSFNVSGFNQTIEDFGARKIATGKYLTARGSNDSLRLYFRYLVYVVGDRVKLQKYTDPDFGVFRDTLPLGRYDMVIAAIGDAANKKDTAQEYYLPNFTLQGKDIFYKYLPINVDGPINQDMYVKRTVAKLRVNILDKLPNDVKFVNMALFNYPAVSTDPNLSSGFNYITGKINGTSKYQPYDIYKATDSTIGMAGLSTDCYILTEGAGRTIGVQLTAYGEGQKVIAKKQIYNVSLYTSKVTALSGNLFDGVSNDGVRIFADSVLWRRDSIKIGF